MLFIMFYGIADYLSLQNHVQLNTM